ncbi:hypothetical protein [Lachnoclostridium sp. An181]|uniref:hypothetical protein n=1 Tax=Lachnoclostridium sp. An181 TaxID=1965575 RepID=UPI001FA8CC6B|nr:hypothetical protein [Lachnoclostridium sp. An181]
MTGIEVNKRCDMFPSAVFIDSISVMSGIQKELFNTEFRKICFHSEKGMEKRKHVMAGSTFQKREYREVTMGIGRHEHVEVVTEEIAFPMGVPAPAAVRLRIMAFTVTGRTAFFLAIAGTRFALLRGSTDRSAITGKSQMVWINEAFRAGNRQKLLVIKPENKGKWISRFEFPAFQQRKKFRCSTGRIAGSFIAFLFPLRWFHFRETVFGGMVVGVSLPDAGKEIIKSSDTGSIPERETTEDSIKRSFPEHAAPDCDRSHFQFQSKQVRAQHTGRESWSGAKNRVTFLHNGIREGKIKIPELHDIIPGTLRKHEGIRIKLKEIGYESILISGMAARITR